MNDYKIVPTNAFVWHVLHKNHPTMRVFSSYSSQGTMHTSYGFEIGDYPVIEARTTWEVDPNAPHKRVNEKHKYWLCLPERGSE